MQYRFVIVNDVIQVVRWLTNFIFNWSRH